MSDTRKIFLGKFIFVVTLVLCSWIIWYVYAAPPELVHH